MVRKFLSLMADQKDQHSDPPAEDPKFIPLQIQATKSLPGYNRAPESKPEYDSESNDSDDDEDMIDEFAEEFKKKKLEELKLKAFYFALLAFKAETSTMSNKRGQIIEKLMKELDITHETRMSFEDNIQKNLTALQQRVDSDAEGIEIVKEKPLTISEKKPTLIPNSVATPRSSWGKVNPEALVGKRVRVRMPCEEKFEDFVIKEYDATNGKHRLENVDSGAMETDEMLSWMDLREVPPADIRWRAGENPNIFSTPGLGARQ